MTMKKTKRNLNLICKLGDDEVNERASEAGEIDQEIQDLEDEIDEAKKLNKAEVNERANRRRLLLREIRTKQTTRSVECEVDPDWLNLRVITTRLDTGEIVGERGMTEDEKQGRLMDLEDASVEHSGADAS